MENKTSIKNRGRVCIHPWRETKVGYSFKVPHVNGGTQMRKALAKEGIIYDAFVTTNGVWMRRIA
jgi:hypothetical protein